MSSPPLVLDSSFAGASAASPSSLAKTSTVESIPVVWLVVHLLPIREGCDVDLRYVRSDSFDGRHTINFKPSTSYFKILCRIAYISRPLCIAGLAQRVAVEAALFSRFRLLSNGMIININFYVAKLRFLRFATCLLILSRRPFCRLPKIPDDALGGPCLLPDVGFWGEWLRRIMFAQDRDCRRNREVRDPPVFAMAAPTSRPPVAAAVDASGPSARPLPAEGGPVSGRMLARWPGFDAMRSRV